MDTTEAQCLQASILCPLRQSLDVVGLRAEVTPLMISKRLRDVTKICVLAAALSLGSALCGCWRSSSAPDSQRRVATLQEQKLCSDGADKSFSPEQNAVRDTYTSHLDPVSQTCYVETTTVLMVSSQPYTSSYSHTIYDAFERRVYGDFQLFSDRDKPDRCLIEPRDREKITCNSQEEFDKLALHYFGTTPD